MKPRIVCAANRYEDGTLLIGARHWDRHMCRQADALTIKGTQPPPEDGFIDQFDKFYTREEAWVIAVENNQIIRECGNANEKILWSEHLY